MRPGLVNFRTPTYRRPDLLRRCLGSMLAQTWGDWVCDVFDDDPDGGGEAVVRALGDPRIRYHRNDPQRFAGGNIDRCFSRENPHGAEFFAVVEDDNYLLPRFAEANVAELAREGRALMMRNQLVDPDDGTPPSAEVTVLGGKIGEGVYDPRLFRLAVIADIGVSNGALFWSRHAVSDLQIGVPCSATVQEYLRTLAVREPIHVAAEPLAVWVRNGAGSTRGLGQIGGRIRRIADDKKIVAWARREAWRQAGPAERRAFLEGRAFLYPQSDRRAGLVKSLISVRRSDAIPQREFWRLLVRGALILALGRGDPGVRAFLRSAGSLPGGLARSTQPIPTR